MIDIQKFTAWLEAEREKAYKTRASWINEDSHRVAYFKGKAVAFDRCIDEVQNFISEDATEGGDKDAK